MTQRAVFASLIDHIFGDGSAKFDITVTQSNNVIGALANQTDFTAFKQNFEARLERLNAATLIDTNLRHEVLAAVNRIADAGWDGAYAELVALDYFLAEPETGAGKILLDRTVLANETLASEMGMQNANHDMSFPALSVSMDTKLLSDKTGDILDSIFKEFCSAKSISHLLIVPSYDLDSDFTHYAVNRKALLKELIDGVDPILQPTGLTSEIISGLSYKFAWKPGIYSGESSYSPIKHAQQHHSLLFGHAKKFSRHEHSVIVFVIFPWSGEKAFPFEDSKRTFFKQFGQHFFNDYLESTDCASKYNQKFKSTILAGKVTQYLSGVIFLEDQAITANNADQLNIDASYIWNENAINQLSGHLFETILHRRGAFNLKSYIVK